VRLDEDVVTTLSAWPSTKGRATSRRASLSIRACWQRTCEFSTNAGSAATGTDLPSMWRDGWGCGTR